MSTGANHGDGVKLCAVYQRIEDPFLGSSWSIFRSSVGVWYLLCFAHGNWWWNFVAESDQLNMGHDNIWYSRPRKFGAGSRKCKACSNGCVQFLISETFIWCWCLQAWLDQEIPLEPVQAVLPWVRQGHRLPEAGLVMNIQPQNSIVRYSNLMFSHCWIAELAGWIWQELRLFFRGDTRGGQGWPPARRRPGSWEVMCPMDTAGNFWRSQILTLWKWNLA